MNLLSGWHGRADVLRVKWAHTEEATQYTINDEQTQAHLTAEPFCNTILGSVVLHLWRYSNENHNLMGQKVHRCLEMVGNLFSHVHFLSIFEVEWGDTLCTHKFIAFKSFTCKS